MSSNGLEMSQFVYSVIKFGEIVLKGINWVHNDKLGANGLERSAKISSYILERSQMGTQYIKLGQMVLKGVNWVHIDKIGSYHLERSQLYTQ